MNQKLKIVLIIAVVLILGFGIFIFLKRNSLQPIPVEIKQPASTSNPIINTENPTTNNSNLKTYRNEEWGFEFQYPDKLILKEKVFGGYYSKFNLEIFLQQKGLDSVFLLNIVLPKFVETSFWKSQENTSKIIVDGREGIKYEYEYDGFKYVTVILPFGEYKIILGTGDGSKPYNEELNQILSSFRFLEK